jgi:hypothetical protein
LSNAADSVPASQATGVSLERAGDIGRQTRAREEHGEPEAAGTGNTVRPVTRWIRLALLFGQAEHLNPGGERPERAEPRAAEIASRNTLGGKHKAESSHLRSVGETTALPLLQPPDARPADRWSSPRAATDAWLNGPITSSVRRTRTIAPP